MPTPELNAQVVPTFERLRATLERQRAAHRAQPVPTLAQRRDDLRRLQAFLRTHEREICTAVDADYGHRSAHETRLTELAPAIDGISHVLKVLPRWMQQTQA